MSAARPRLTSSLRWRLSTAICGAILLCTMLFVTASVIFLQQQLTNNATSDLRTTLNTVPQYLQSEDADLRGLALLVAGDPVVLRDVRTDNAQQLGVHLIHTFATLNVDILDVVDRSGRVLVREEDLNSPHDNVAWMPTIRDAVRSGKNGFALETDSRGRVVVTRIGQGPSTHVSRQYVPPPVTSYALRSTIPLRLNGRILGAIVVGRLLDNAFAQGISHALASSVNLIVAGQRTGSSLTDENGLPVTGLPESRAILSRIALNKSTISQTSENGNAVLSGLVPLPGNSGKPAGAIELVSRLSPLYSLITRLSFLLVSLGALVVIVGTLFALDISRRLTSRLQILESTASHVAQMANFDAPLTDMREVVAVRGGDEVASLARSFSAMMAALDARMDANAQLYSAAQARVRELTGLAEIARLLTAGPNIRETLHVLGEQACRLVGCSAVAIWLPGEGPLPPLYGGHGLPEYYEDITSLAMRESTSERLLTVSDAALREGSPQWRRIDGSPAGLPAAQAALRTAARELGWRSATAVPLRVGDHNVGALTCYTESITPMSETDLGLLTTIADQVAVAVENARLYRQSRDLATLQERARLARDLHDSVTQALFSMTMHARAAQMALTREGVGPDGPVGKSLRQLGDLTQGALAEMRALIFELRPGALAEEGLAAALRKQAAALSVREGLHVQIDAPAERILLEEQQEEHLYRLALESLNNTVKHACASHVSLLLATDAATNQLTLEIQDDGVGFDMANVPPGHLGLGTMSERARLINATFEVQSAPGQGTTVRVSLPPSGDLPAESPEAALAQRVTQ